MKKLIPALALAISSPALAQDVPQERPETSGTVSCSVASGYILQKVLIQVADTPQFSCNAALNIATDIGVFSPSVWNTSDIDFGFSAETDIGISYKPDPDSPLTFSYQHFFIDGEQNDIDQYSVSYSAKKWGSFSGEILNRQTGKTGFVASYNLPKWVHEIGRGRLVHGPTISYASRAGSGDNVVNLRYNAILSYPVSESVSLVLRGQFAQPLAGSSEIDGDPLGQLNLGLSKKF